jgi:hypothetical protein
MTKWMRGSATLAFGLLLWTGAASAQTYSAPGAQTKTPERIEGQVVRIDEKQGKVTVRASDGTTHEFAASPETLRDLKVGERIEAKRRQ